jgi:hypothetical protein
MESKPASAATNPPVQIAAIRLARLLALRKKAITSADGGDAIGSGTPTTIHVSITLRAVNGRALTVIPIDVHTSPPATEKFSTL